MNDKIVGTITNSKSAIETVKRLRPSALFLVSLIFGVAFTIRWLFSDIAGYSLMVWFWFASASVTIGTAIWAYKIDMAAFTQSTIYNELASRVNEMETELVKHK